MYLFGVGMLREGGDDYAIKAAFARVLKRKWGRLSALSAER